MDTPPEIRLRQLMKNVSLSSSGLTKIVHSDVNLTNIHELWLGDDLINKVEDFSVDLAMMQSTRPLLKQKIPFTLTVEEFEKYFLSGKPPITSQQRGIISYF